MKLLRKSWHFLRLVAGEYAYEHYLGHMAEHHPEASPLSRKAFYAERMKRKWEGISRCC
jgi:uncharacterized short protein YbdD (DUF466 family)